MRSSTSLYGVFCFWIARWGSTSKPKSIVKSFLKRYKIKHFAVFGKVFV